MQYWRFLVHAGPEAGQPLSARARDADVPRLAGLDRPAGRSARSALAIADAPAISSAPTPASRLFVCVLVMWFCAEDRDRDRRPVAAELAPRVRRHRALPRQCTSSRRCSSILLSPIMWFGHTHLPRRPAVRPRDRLDRPDARRSRGAVSRRRCAICGRTRCSAVRIARLAGADASGRDPLCAVSRRRPGAGDPARGDHRLACARPAAARGSASAACPRKPRRRPSCTALGAAGDRAGAPAPRPIGLTPMLEAFGPRAASSGRCASTTATARARAAMDRLYGQFVRPGDLVFDIGAHVGDRVASFRRLGARVVAVEPQPALARDAAGCSTAATPMSRSSRWRSAAAPARSS